MMNAKPWRWAAFFHLCWLTGHDDEQILDHEERRAYNRCAKCGREWQYDFQLMLSPAWIGWCDPDHRCELCFGWKPRAWSRCGNEVCTLNPDGPLRIRPDGSYGHDLDRTSGGKLPG